MTKPCFPGTGIPYGTSPFRFFLAAVAFATRTLLRFGGAGTGVGVGEACLVEVSEESLGGVSLLCLGLFRRGCGVRGFGAGRANELRIDLKTSSKGPACPMSGALNRVTIDRHMTILWSGGFID